MAISDPVATTTDRDGSNNPVINIKVNNKTKDITSNRVTGNMTRNRARE